MCIYISMSTVLTNNAFNLKRGHISPPITGLLQKISTPVLCFREVCGKKKNNALLGILTHPLPFDNKCQVLTGEQWMFPFLSRKPWKCWVMSLKYLFLWFTECWSLTQAFWCLITCSPAPSDYLHLLHPDHLQDSSGGMACRLISARWRWLFGIARCLFGIVNPKTHKSRTDS